MKDMYEGLDEQFRDKLRLFEQKLAAAGMRVRMVCGLRSVEEQARLYSIGRRGKPGEKMVTNAKPGYSYHNFGLAADYAVGGLSAQQREQFGQIAESLGLTWGGRWQIGDFGHVEWRALPLAKLRAGVGQSAGWRIAASHGRQGVNPCPTKGGATPQGVRIVVDGQVVVEGQFMDDKRVWGPVRPVAEALGASVEDRVKIHGEVVLKRT